jgi:hypothetical protein
MPLKTSCREVKVKPRNEVEIDVFEPHGWRLLAEIAATMTS